MTDLALTIYRCARCTWTYFSLRDDGSQRPCPVCSQLAARGVPGFVVESGWRQIGTEERVPVAR